MENGAIFKRKNSDLLLGNINTTLLVSQEHSKNFA